MNMRRGLFRFWLIFSLLFAISYLSLDYGHIKKGFEQSSFEANKPYGFVQLPIDCEAARGVKNEDYKVFCREDLTVEPTPLFRPPIDLLAKRPKIMKLSDVEFLGHCNDQVVCWYDIRKFRNLYHEYDALTDEELANKVYAHPKTPRHPNPWLNLLRTLAVAIGLPLAVLFLGIALLWGFAGFKTNK